MSAHIMQHTLQHTALQYTVLQHTATHCNTIISRTIVGMFDAQSDVVVSAYSAILSATHCAATDCIATHCTATHCTAMHCTATHCTATRCTATHCCNTLQHAATPVGIGSTEADKDVRTEKAVDKHVKYCKFCHAFTQGHGHLFDKRGSQ